MSPYLLECILFQLKGFGIESYDIVPVDVMRFKRLVRYRFSREIQLGISSSSNEFSYKIVYFSDFLSL